MWFFVLILFQNYPQFFLENEQYENIAYRVWTMEIEEPTNCCLATFSPWVNLLNVVAGTWKVPESIEQQQIIKWLFCPWQAMNAPLYKSSYLHFQVGVLTNLRYISCCPWLLCKLGSQASGEEGAKKQQLSCKCFENKEYYKDVINKSL